MKAKMIVIAVTVSLFVLAFGLCLGWAGSVLPPDEVSVDLDSSTAFGTMVGARNSQDDFQAIGCNVSYSSQLITPSEGSPYYQVYNTTKCAAVDVYTNSLSCGSNSSEAALVAANIRPDSLIYFVCNGPAISELTVYQDSRFLPKQNKY